MEGDALACMLPWTPLGLNVQAGEEGGAEMVVVGVKARERPKVGRDMWLTWLLT